MKSRIKENYNHTLYACFIGYIIQAIVNNFVPLLFLTFQREYGISLEKISLLITLNFGVQLLVDFLAAGFTDRIGYRICVIAAQLFSCTGLLALAFLPELMPDPFFGLLCAGIIYAIGGGLIEVLISPIVESCPTRRKKAAMGLLHSFYCWGHAAVILISTLFFAAFGIQNWRTLACIWAAIPLLNALYFTQVPIASLNEEGAGMTIAALLKTRMFWFMIVLMVCAGACEQGISQWASAFAESSLNVSKTVGDLAGCALCGLSVGVMWPGTFSLSSRNIPGGGTAMFAFLALAGDVGCAGGPTLVGFISGHMKTGILTGIVFPLLLISTLLFLMKNRRAG